MTITGQEDAIPARNGGSELVDYSLKESNRRLILERRKVALFADKTAYKSTTNDVISITISPGANDEWLDGRSSYITATLNTTGTNAEALYLPNGPAACFQQVQIVSASGQQLVNIMDYHTIQQMFSEWTTSYEWVAGAGQMYGTGDWETGQWDPARYGTCGTGAFVGTVGQVAVASGTSPFGGTAVVTTGYGFTTGEKNPQNYDPWQTKLKNVSYSDTTTDAIGANSILQQSCGKALGLQAGMVQSSGVRVAFRLDLAWIFGNATLIPAQFFPLTLRATLVSPTTSLSYIGIDSALDYYYGGSLPAGAGNNPTAGTGPLSVATGNTLVAPGIAAVTAAPGSNVELTFSNVKFMASLCKVAPTFKAKVESQMAGSTFSMTVTNYFTTQNSIPSSQSTATVNTTWSAHDNQAFYMTFIPQSGENTYLYNNGYKFGGMNTATGKPYIQNSQLLLNGRYFPPQPDTDLVDQFHATLDAFNASSENVAFSPISYYSYALGRNYALGFLLDRDQGSSLTGVSSVSSPTWTFQASIPGFAGTQVPANLGNLNVHTCIAYTQVLEVLKDGQIKIFQ